LLYQSWAGPKAQGCSTPVHASVIFACPILVLHVQLLLEEIISACLRALAADSQPFSLNLGNKTIFCFLI
jgi:hypothetical protein